MVLDWFSRGTDVTELIAKKKYARAIEVLDGQLREDAGNPRLRMQLADVLVLAGQPQEAVPVLMELADYYGAERQAAKAIATLKKIQRIAPGRRDVETRLASLIKGKSKPAAWSPREGIGAEGYEAAGAVFGAEHFEQQAVVTDEERIAAAKQASWQPSLQAEEQAPAAIPVIPGLGESAPPPAPPRQEPAAEASQASFESHMLSAIQHALKTPMAPSPPAAGDTQGAVAQSPLFSDFSEEELVAVIQGMELLIFEAGDIIISEGDPGDSLFVVTTGTAKAFVRRDGKQTLAREMAEGTFFGEISILSGKPRTATVTAATPCELLELDRATLDEITKTHPNVQKVLEDFYIARASGTPDAR